MRKWTLSVLLVGLLGCGGGPGNQADTSSVPSLPRGEYPVKPVAVGKADLPADVVLLVTGGTNGRMEVCNCAGVMPGGMSRRAGLFASYRAVYPNCLTLDTGDAFWISPDPVRHAFLLRGMKMLGYDALVMGDQEWITPAADLKKLLSEGGVTCLSSNVHPREGSLPISDVLRRRVGSVDLAVVSYADDRAFMFFPPDARQALVRGGREVLAAQVAALKAQGAVVVVVVHGEEQTAADVAKVPGVDAVIRGHSTKTGQAIQRQGTVPVVQIGGPEQVGVLGLAVRNGRVAKASWRAEVLDDRWPADRRLLELYQAYTHAAMTQALNAQRKQGLDYVASSECGQCHASELKAWQSTAHAHAYSTLVKANRAGDPDCLMCHTSGFGTEQGFYTIERTPDLANVNCQDCHRFNVDEHVAGGQRKPDFQAPPANEELCRSCHTASNSPLFVDATYRARIVVRGHGLK